MTLKMPGVEDDFAMSEVAEALSRKALPPLVINFTPLKQERSFKVDELMQFYRDKQLFTTFRNRWIWKCV
ncbi:phenylalanine--tRNA ligase [Trifolium repens]|nr:phenylalanine--tRNA ligase [Trifolium repens]